jgi:hypothetical protein
MKVIQMVLMCAALLCSLSKASAQMPFKKVMIVVLENSNYGAAINEPNLAAFAKRGALLTNFYASTHPSQGNYVAMIAGDTYGIGSDSPVNLSGYHIGDLLEAKGLNWKIYSEGYPTQQCFTGPGGNGYARKHNPFMSFLNVSQDQARCMKHIVNSQQLAQDFAQNKIPEFSIYVPNLDNDGHDTGLPYAGNWLAKTFGPLVNNPLFMKDLVIIVTFDESTFFGGNHIYTALYGPSIIPGSINSTRFGFSNILRTIEVGLGLGNLGKGDANSGPVTGIWK